VDGGGPDALILDSRMRAGPVGGLMYAKDVDVGDSSLGEFKYTKDGKGQGG
jgi:hypothetical protein